MKPRPPLLGYNHNVRHNGALFHVQTEDSGQQNPHIFTHVFSGGTILASKRSEYPPTADEKEVQGAMQAQHKAMLRELRSGAFDEKAARLLGGAGASPPVAPSLAASAAPVSAPARAPAPPTPSAVPPPPDVVRVVAARPPIRPSVPPPAPTPPAPLPRAARQTMTIGSRRGSRQAPPAAFPGSRAPSPRPAPPFTGRSSADGVVVARPAVIVGDRSGSTTPRRMPGQPPATSPGGLAGREPSSRPAPGGARAAGDNIFGADLVSEKSLDEVILAYLAEETRRK